ncbi:MAG: DUF4412 domain-containing protein [Woeseiaceae bacterium]
MKLIKTFTSCSLLALSLSASAGVEMQLLTKDTAGEMTESVTLYAQDGRIRMEDIGNSSGQEMSMIFVGQEFIVVDHSDKSYIIMDEAMVAEMGAKVNDAMAQIRAQLADMPPEQRAMMEQMLEQQMGAMMDTAAESIPTRIEETGSGNWQSGDCTEYAVFVGDTKAQDICAAPLRDIEGAEEAMEAFRGMAKFIKSMADAMPGALGEAMAENPMGLMEEIDGFPVRTVDYVDGQKHSETTLESVQEKGLDAALFDVPDGYRKVDPFAGQ